MAAVLLLLLTPRPEDTPGTTAHKPNSNPTPRKSTMLRRFRASVGRRAKLSASSNGDSNERNEDRTEGNKSDNRNPRTVQPNRRVPPQLEELSLEEELRLLEEEFGDDDELREAIQEGIRATFLPSHRCALHHTGIPDQPPPSYAKNALDHIITETYLGVVPLMGQGPFRTRAHADAAIRDMVNASVDRGLERMKLCARLEEARHLGACSSRRDSVSTQDELDMDVARYMALIRIPKTMERSATARTTGSVLSSAA